MARPRLGDILVKMGFLDAQQLQAALGHQKKWGYQLARTVVEQRFCTIDQVMQALARQTGYQLIDLDREPLGPQLAPLLPRKIAEQHHAVPLRVEGKRHEVLVVAMGAPATLAQLDAVTSASGKQRVIPFLAWDEAIERALGRVYRGESYAPPASAPVAAPKVPMGLREEEFDLVGTEPLVTAADPLAPLGLSEACRQVIRTAARQHQMAETAVIARVIESWASKQGG